VSGLLNRNHVSVRRQNDSRISLRWQLSSAKFADFSCSPATYNVWRCAFEGPITSDPWRRGIGRVRAAAANIDNDETIIAFGMRKALCRRDRISKPDCHSLRWHFYSPPILSSLDQLHEDSLFALRHLMNMWWLTASYWVLPDNSRRFVVPTRWFREHGQSLNRSRRAHRHRTPCDFRLYASPSGIVPPGIRRMRATSHQ